MLLVLSDFRIRKRRKRFRDNLASIPPPKVTSSPLSTPRSLLFILRGTACHARAARTANAQRCQAESGSSSPLLTFAVTPDIPAILILAAITYEPRLPRFQRHHPCRTRRP